MERPTLLKADQIPPALRVEEEHALSGFERGFHRGVRLAHATDRTCGNRVAAPRWSDARDPVRSRVREAG
jgi:hypothetical protein